MVWILCSGSQKRRQIDDESPCRQWWSQRDRKSVFGRVSKRKEREKKGETNLHNTDIRSINLLFLSQREGEYVLKFAKLFGGRVEGLQVIQIWGVDDCSCL